MSAFYAGEFVVERGFGKHARTNASIFHIVVKVRVSEVRFAEPIGFNFPDPDFWVIILSVGLDMLCAGLQIVESFQFLFHWSGLFLSKHLSEASLKV